MSRVLAVQMEFRRPFHKFERLYRFQVPSVDISFRLLGCWVWCNVNMVPFEFRCPVRGHLENMLGAASDSFRPQRNATKEIGSKGEERNEGRNV